MENTDLKSFVQNELLSTKSLQEILNIADLSKRGFVYERIWDIIIRSGICQSFQIAITLI